MTARRPLLHIAIALTLLALPAARAQDSTTAPAPHTEQAQPANAERAAPPARLASPRASMFTFLEAMERAAQVEDPRARARALQRAVETFDLPQAAGDSAAIAAEKLLLVLNRIERVQRWDLPDADDVRSQSLERFQFFPRSERSARHQRIRELAPDAEITLVRMDDAAWRFSRATMEGIDEFHRRVESLEPVAGVVEEDLKLSLPMRIRAAMPDALKSGTALWLEYWQWAGLAALVFLAVVIDYLLQTILRATAVRAIRRRKGEARSETLTKTVRPLGLFGAALFVLATVWLLALPAAATDVLSRAIHFVLLVSGVWAAIRITDLVAEVLASKAAATTTRFDDLLIPLGRKTIKILIVLLGVFYLAKYVLGEDPLPILTGLGIGGLAVAFAAKDTIENFFGSVAVIMDRPFEVGDWVSIGETEGLVEELGFRSTRIRTFYNSLVTVPNSTLVRATVDNYGRRRYRRVSTFLSLAYDTPPERIEAFCEAVRELVRMHPYTRKDYYNVYLNRFGAHSLDVLLYVFHDCPDWTTELRERQRLFLDILRVARRLGVEFAYPTQTLFLKRGEDVAPQDAPPPPASIDEQALHDGRRAAHAATRNAPWRDETPAPERISTRPAADFLDDEDQGPG